MCSIETKETGNSIISHSNCQSMSQKLSHNEVLALIKEERYDEAIDSMRFMQTNHLKEYEASNNWNIFLIKLIKDNKTLIALSSSSSDLIQSIHSFFTNINEGKASYSPVIRLNLNIFYFGIGQYETMMTYYKRHISNSSNDYILFVNSTLILIEVSLIMNMNQYTYQLISLLENYLESNNNTQETEDDESRTIQKITMSYNGNEKAIEYYNSNEIYHKDINMNKELILLLKAYLHLNQSQYGKATKYLNDFKSIYSISHLKKSNPLYGRLKRMYNVLKIKLIYCNNTQFKFYKHLDSLCEANAKDNETSLFKYNSYGILNLKLKKVKYAEYYFSMAMQIAKANRRLLIKYGYCIIFNLALCSFYSLNYEKCYARLISIKDNEVIQNNPYYYYRLGLCLIEKDFKSNIHKGVLRRFIRYSPIYSQSEGGGLEETKDNQSRFYNKVKEDNDNDKNDKENEQHQSINPNRAILFNLSMNKPNHDLRIKEAIGYFKQCCLLLKGYHSFKEEIDNTIAELGKGQYNKVNKDNNITNKLSINCNNTKDSPDSSQELYTKLYSSSICHLLFCLILTANYNEVIYYGNKYLLDINDNQKEHHHIIQNYLAEAYIHLGKTRHALHILLNNPNPPNDNRGSVYSRNSNNQFNEVNYQLALRCNIIKVHFLNGNINEIEKGIKELLNSIENKDIPPYIINTLLYYYLTTKQKKKEAIKLITHWKISP